MNKNQPSLVRVRHATPLVSRSCPQCGNSNTSFWKVGYAEYWWCGNCNTKTIGNDLDPRKVYRWLYADIDDVIDMQ